jgi:thiamine-monophosphate kinase
MIDLSDGLSSDLGHILDESGGLGAILDAETIPIHDDAHSMSRLGGLSPLLRACSDGEDFELCFTVAPQDAERLLREPPPPSRLFRIGTVVVTPGIWLRDDKGALMPLSPSGFDHFKS